MRVTDLKTFIEKASIVHNNKYTYLNSVYVTTSTKLLITCPKHGDFLQSPNSHLSGKGCFECRNEKDSLLKKDTLRCKETVNFS